MKRGHAMPFGAEVLGNGAVRFQIWAPAARRIDLRLEDAPPRRQANLPMQLGAEGRFSLVTREAGPGTLYRYVIDGEIAVPDPASRFQPEDVHGPSEVVDPGAYDWQDAQWRGRPWHEAVLYELHVGTFTPEGTYTAAQERLDYLADLGITAVELMPISEAPGGRNWGYDGVLPFAPEHRYGSPKALKTFVDAAHRRGLMVFLDVVYNHFGPEGNYLHRYAPNFFTNRHSTPWGAAINFDTPQCRPVRDYFVHNALYWIEEFHLDGFRLDAVHAIRDESRPHILEEIASAVRSSLAPDRQVHLVLENDDNGARWLARDEAGAPRLYTAQWNDDLHHVLHVLTTGETAGYYGDYAERPAARLGRALAEGFVYQGEPSPHRDGTLRGEPSAQLPATAFVSFLQNHDQIGNRAMGERIGALASAEALRAALSIIALAPSPPLLFMGEEWNAPNPFPFFCDFGPDLADAVRAGRRREFARFPEFADPAALARIPDPLERATFEAARLEWAQITAGPHRDWLSFVRGLLALRRAEIVPRLVGMKAGGDYRVDSEGAVEVRWRLGDGTVLQAILALSARGAPGAATVPSGRPLYMTSPADDTRGGALPAWYAGWFLASAEAAG